MKILKNYPFSSKELVPEGKVIEIKESDPEWASAHEAWRSGKTPTENPLWKFGVFFGTV